MANARMPMPQEISPDVFTPLIGPIHEETSPWPLTIFGIFGAGYVTLRPSTLDLPTSDGTIVKILAPRGMSSAQMSVSALTLTKRMTPRVQFAQASALTTSLRQLFPASATAVFATFLMCRLISCRSFHFSDLSNTDKPGSMAVVDESGQRQAAVWAFDDVLLAAAILAFVALSPVVVYGSPNPKRWNS